MATYKVIQDIEADDKLLGPLTLRQFVYAGITVFFLYLSYMAVFKGAPFLLALFVPPIFLFGFFAFPWGKEQPTELWALARIRFLVKPRIRVWDQDGMKELVTVTVPKKIEVAYTDGLSQNEVRSRLRALSDTLDSRGWAIKSANISPYTAPVFAGVNGATTDRLVEPTSMPQEVPTLGNTNQYTDMFDTASSPKAQQFDTMLHTQADEKRQQLINQMQQPQDTPKPQPQTPSSDGQPADYWFMSQQDPQTIPKGQQTFGSSVVNPVAADNTFLQPAVSQTDDEAALVEDLKHRAIGEQLQKSHMATVLPIEEQERIAREQAERAALAASQTPVTDQPDTAILELAQNDDLNIETIARQAKKAHGEDMDEVVVSLH